MTDEEFKKAIITELVAIREVLEDMSRSVNLSLDGIEHATKQSRDYIESLRMYTIGQIRRGG